MILTTIQVSQLYREYLAIKLSTTVWNFSSSSFYTASITLDAATLDKEVLGTSAVWRLGRLPTLPFICNK